MHRASRENTVVRYADIIRGMERRARMGTTITVERVVDSMMGRHVVHGRMSGGIYAGRMPRFSPHMDSRAQPPTHPDCSPPSWPALKSPCLLLEHLRQAPYLPLDSVQLIVLPLGRSLGAALDPLRQFLLQFPLRRPVRFLLVGFRFPATCDSYDSYSKA